MMDKFQESNNSDFSFASVELLFPQYLLSESDQSFFWKYILLYLGFNGMENCL
jgi:hypothetical protein